MKRNLYQYGFVVLLLLSVSCKKNESEIDKALSKGKDSAALNLKGLSSSMMLNSLATSVFENHDDDSIERVTILGNQLTNPYLIPNMQQAYRNLSITNVPVNVTNLYVRFKPSSVDQLDVLTTAMEAQNLEVFDTPVDYDVTYEGDYYQDPSIPQEQITWQYAVVPPNFQFPSGIQYETLAQIHIPGDNYTAVETEAERLAASSTNQPNSVRPQPNVPQCDIDNHWDYAAHTCVPNDCPIDYYWNGTSCQPNTPPPTSQPPAPAVDASVPGGGILVYDTQTNTNRPVKKATIVARRWFKIERGFTDNNGHYQLTKRFKNNVRVLVKFKNGDAEVRGLRGVRLWQMLFPLKKAIGLFSGDKSNISYTFATYTNPNSKGNRYWAGATTNNAVQDYRDYAPVEGIGLPPTGLKILLTNNIPSGASPMWNKRTINNLPKEFVYTYLASATVVTGIIDALIIVLKHQIDIAVSYKYPTSDELKETIYHELTHAAHYAALGNGWYGPFVDAELSALNATYFSDKAYVPYGRSTSSYHNIIALGESWAYYMGHYLADKEYGRIAGCQNEQIGGGYYCNANNTRNPHLDVLEAFDPNLQGDPFNWIPQGLFYDLKDPANETNFPVTDQVSGYTNQQMFNAFQSNITNLQDYRIKLLQSTTNPTSGFVPNLFFQYHY
ncbi:hypothetical protein [Mucilaginibacter sp.]|uniref:hypothetical protein n=1 Tax=Mucilaginibacter sp. TaxID=1882438 RepID=UPI003AFFB5FD